MVKPNPLCILFILIIVLAFPIFSYGQNVEPEILKLHREIPSDPYLPNEHKNIKTSPAYKYNNRTVSGQTSTVFTNQVNIDISGLNILSDAANEPSIAVNPLNQNEIAIGWRQFDNVSSNFRQAGWAYTDDGGQTWTFPGVIEPGIFRSDPVLNYDNSGNFYYNSLTVDTSFTIFSCDVFKSTNGGITWPNKVFAHGGDKQWMAIDRTSGVGSGNIYAYWTFAYTFCPPDFFTRSTNGGLSYEACTAIPGNPFWGKLTVGNAGELYIGSASQNYYDLIVVKSLNAQTPGSTISWNYPVPVFMDGNVASGPGVNPAGLLGQVSIDVDRSSGPGQDNVYLLASLERISAYDPGDVMFARSTDGGLTWSFPEQINDDNSTSNTQWFGTMSVAPNGRVDAVWLDTRDSPVGSDSSALYYSFSTDEGNTWSVNEKLSGLFDPHVGYPNQDKMGDYFDMVSDNTGAHLAWANTLNGEQDVYYSYIIPSVPTGLNENSNHPIISVYPNPGSSFFTVDIPKTYEEVSITVYSYQGQSVKSFQFKQTDKLILNLSDLDDGIYLLKTSINNQLAICKSIVKISD